MHQLQFACQPGCVACCDQHGYIYLNEADVQRAATFVGLDAETFRSRYVYRTRHQMRLRKPKDKQCPFLLDKGCSIHPAKPTQCRTFPFWPELVSDRKQWRAAAKYCPGIGTGQLIQIGTALEVASEMETAHPQFYSAKKA